MKEPEIIMYDKYYQPTEDVDKVCHISIRESITKQQLKEQYPEAYKKYFPNNK